MTPQCNEKYSEYQKHWRIKMLTLASADGQWFLEENAVLTNLTALNRTHESYNRLVWKL